MSVRIARERRISLRLAKAWQCIGIAATLVLFFNDTLQTAVAEGATRTLSFHNAHTDETITITYKRNGRYDEAALTKLNWFMRDWRREEVIKMDPQLFDLVWETYREAGSRQPIEVICGYRSPETNAMLRARSSGVAQFSQHTQGHALDFFMPDVPLEKVRIIGLRLQRGGVGFYPTSGSPFVHLDTGTIRHWPRMTHDQLVKVFPDERTVHIPSDGQPLAGYALALADVERQGRTPSNVSLVAARDSGVIDADEERAARQPKRSFLAGLFGFGKADSSEPAKPAARAPLVTASINPGIRVTTERIVPLPKGRPVEVAAATPLPSPRPVALASLEPGVIEARGLWPADDAAAPSTTASVGPALAYAPATAVKAPANRARAMGAGVPQPTAMLAGEPAAELTGGRLDGPWLRAVMLTPSARGFMTVTRMGRLDLTSLHSLLRKPPSTLVMTFSDDPHHGMVADRFNGQAVVFLATATFVTRTASLQ